jgi:hypothetical protein
MWCGFTVANGSNLVESGETIDDPKIAINAGKARAPALTASYKYPHSNTASRRRKLDLHFMATNILGARPKHVHAVEMALMHCLVSA